MPVVFLSAYGHDEAIARAFEAGAADYVVKPFSPTELVARIRAALRNATAPVEKEPEEPLVLPGLIVDFARRRVTVGGRPVKLTVIEYRLLAELSVNAGSILTHKRLLQRIWHKTSGSDTRPLRSAVKSLRRKLGRRRRQPYLYLQRTGCGVSNGARRVGVPPEGLVAGREQVIFSAEDAGSSGQKNGRATLVRLDLLFILRLITCVWRFGYLPGFRSACRVPRRGTVRINGNVWSAVSVRLWRVA